MSYQRMHYSPKYHALTNILGNILFDRSCVTECNVRSVTAKDEARVLTTKTLPNLYRYFRALTGKGLTPRVSKLRSNAGFFER